MHLYKTLKSFLYDQDYFVDLWKDCLHVYGIVEIDTLKEQKIVLTLEKFKLEINGENFRVLKLSKKEILIQGEVSEMKVLR